MENAIIPSDVKDIMLQAIKNYTYLGGGTNFYYVIYTSVSPNVAFLPTLATFTNPVNGVMSLVTPVVINVGALGAGNNVVRIALAKKGTTDFQFKNIAYIDKNYSMPTGGTIVINSHILEVE